MQVRVFQMELCSCFSALAMFYAAEYLNRTDTLLANKNSRFQSHRS